MHLLAADCVFYLASGGFVPDSHWTPLRDFRPADLLYPPYLQTPGTPDPGYAAVRLSSTFFLHSSMKCLMKYIYMIFYEMPCRALCELVCEIIYMFILPKVVHQPEQEAF